MNRHRRPQPQQPRPHKNKIAGRENMTLSESDILLVAASDCPGTAPPPRKTIQSRTSRSSCFDGGRPDRRGSRGSERPPVKDDWSADTHRKRGRRRLAPPLDRGMRASPDRLHADNGPHGHHAGVRRHITPSLPNGPAHRLRDDRLAGRYAILICEEGRSASDLKAFRDLP